MQQTNASKDLMTYQDVQDLLKVSRQTVYRMVKTARIPSPFKVGERLRWRPEDIEGYLEAMQGSKDANAV